VCRYGSENTEEKAGGEAAGRVSTRDAVEAAIKKLGYTSFDSYLFDRARKTLADMADELRIPRPSFAAEHRRYMLEQAGSADPLTLP